ncbi:MAG TPA: hypothetical protein VF277_03895, partial [Steroidobacteraceae bacterium]
MEQHYDAIAIDPGGGGRRAHALAAEPVTRTDLIAWAVSALLLGLVISLHLLPALLAGLLV